MKPFFVCLLLCLPALLFGQNDQEEAKARYELINKKIDHFLTQNQVDSLAKYYEQKNDFFYSIDNLAAFLYGYCYDLYYDVCDTSPECMVPLLEQAEKRIWRSPKDKEDSLALMIFYRDFGLHLMDLGRNVPKAKRVLEQAKNLLEEGQFRDTISTNIIFKSLGNAYTILGDNERSIRHFSAGIDNPIFNAHSQAGNYLNLAISYWNKNEMEASNQQIEKGLKLENLTAIQLGKFYTQLATNHLALRQYDQALKYGEKAFLFFKKEKESAGLRYLLARIYLKKKDLIQADKNIRLALQLDRRQAGRSIGKAYITFSEILGQQEQWKEALQAANQALASVIPSFAPKDIFALPAREKLYPENTILEALKVKAIILKTWYEEDKERKYLELALACYSQAGEIEQLLRQNYLYESSKLDLLTDSRQSSEAAITLAFQLMTPNQNKEQMLPAFQFAENSKSIVLLDAIKRNAFLSALLEKDSLVQKERDLALQIRFFDRRSEEEEKDGGEQRSTKRVLESELEQLQGQLLDRYPAYQQSLLQEPVNPQQLIEESTGLLEFFFGEKAVYLFLWEKGDGHLFEIGERPEVDSLVQHFLSFFSSRNTIDNAPKDYQRAAFQLYQRLFPAPAQKVLTNKKELIVIPDGLLNFVPFEALVTSAKESLNLGKVDYLIRKHNVRYAYSATVLEQQNQRHSNNKGVLAMAPIFANGERGQIPLHYSPEELKVFKKPFLQEQATLHTFYQNALNSQLIHLSTHAKVDKEGQPRIEFIDSTLFLDELYTLHLDADLVVLSACETGIGTLQKGEGLMSLGRGFAYAGASSLIASLWSVQDASTTWLINDFYRNLHAGQSKSEALHTAKLNYLEQADFNPSPYLWSVLSFIGADKEMEIKEGGFSWWWGVLLLLVLYLGRKLMLRSSW